MGRVLGTKSEVLVFFDFTPVLGVAVAFRVSLLRLPTWEFRVIVWVEAGEGKRVEGTPGADGSLLASGL